MRFHNICPKSIFQEVFSNSLYICLEPTFRVLRQKKKENSIIRQTNEFIILRKKGILSFVSFTWYLDNHFALPPYTQLQHDQVTQTLRFLISLGT